MTYLDWASTSPPDAGLLAEAAELAARSFGNPSSRHALGTEARAGLGEARKRLALAIGARPESVIFTGGGSEADAIPLLALLRAALATRREGRIKPLHLITTEIEHSAVYEEALLLKNLGIEVSLVAAGPDGRVEPSRIAAALTRATSLVAVMAVNNETGAIQPLAAIAKALSDAAANLGRPVPRLHADAVQALGKIEFRPAELGLSSAAFSAHKLRGPRGVGALWNASSLEPLALGGGQEAGLRPGTENLQGAWAFARAAQTATATLVEHRGRARSLEARLIEGLGSIPGAVPLPLGRKPGDEAYSPFILSAAFPGLTGEVLVRVLSDEGIAVSTGAACSSNARRTGRRVLEAMGLDTELALSAIRISTGETTTEAEIDLFLETVSNVYRRLKP